MKLAFIAAAGLLLAPLANTGPGALLRPGMRLAYQSEGPAQAPWTVDSVRADPGLPGAPCVAVRIRRSADPAPLERFCLVRDTLYRWSERATRWDIARPVGPQMTWTSVRPNGDTVRYQTARVADETISGFTIPVVHTTVLTVDSAGKPKARLRERYALGLLTATGGVFEAPDTVRPGQWQARRTFELTGIDPGH